MFNNFDFNDLFVLEMANNHQGDVSHGKKIIQELAQVVKKHGVRAAVKLQFRQLDSFVHPTHQDKSSNKHIPRFMSTRLKHEEFQALVDEIRKHDMMPMSTPFDEESVDICEQMSLDIIKVGSCSAKDWPLLERIADAGRPVIFSTGGLLISDIDKLVSFFDHRGIDYAIMHCVSIYPIPDDKFNLSQIEMLRNRYPKHTIGWSTHEDPKELSAVQIAVAKGARMFERHVGVATDKITLNSYSATPAQIDQWMASYRRALTLCGEFHRGAPSKEEKDALDTLMRGVYLRNDIKAGSAIERHDVYFAMPIQEGQIPSGRWKEGMVASSDLTVHQPLNWSAAIYPPDPPRLAIQSAVHDVKALLNEARIHLSSEFKVEYSHHYGMEEFRKTGCVLIDCVNREYCKKIIVQLPGQSHPLHFHKRKEETFQVLYGVMHVEIDGHHRILHPGETILVLPGVWHRFWTETGCVAEEISTTHFNNDSVYQDKKINAMQRHERKTVVDHWGRFQLPASA
ncbi:MAG: N-acetylneuraminate synthase family protein [Gammaproteobacteria bacterium]|nr:N-acetylneuraminate synthase family protein [Gammaproteobacteria bacterium]